MRSEFVSWRNQIVMAVPKPGTLDFSPHWWDAAPFDRLPGAWEFEYNTKAPLLDVM